MTITSKRSPSAVLASASDLLAPRATRLVCLADVEPERIAWLWDGRIARGMVSLIDGDPDLGKSTLTLDVAARVTSGAPMPCDADGVQQHAPADVILLSAEDHLASTTRPRLDAAGANVRRVHALVAMPRHDDPDAPPSLAPADVKRLDAAIVEHRAALVVIDPLMAFLGADVDAYRDQDVRRVLHALARVAERTGAAIVIVRHLRKGAGSALYRGGGSIGLGAAARSVLLVGRDPSDPTARVIATTKNNNTHHRPALRWRLVGAGDVARIEWLGIAEGITADQLASLPTFDAAPDDRSPASSAVIAVLRELLADGPRPSKEVEDAVRAATGASTRTIARARSQLGVVALPPCRGADGRVAGWMLSLTRDAGTVDVGTLAGALAVDRSLSVVGSVGSLDAHSTATPPISHESDPERHHTANRQNASDRSTASDLQAAKTAKRVERVAPDLVTRDVGT